MNVFGMEFAGVQKEFSLAEFNSLQFEKYQSLFDQIVASFQF